MVILLCLRESTAQGERRIFDILIRNLTVYMPHAHNVTRSLIYNVRENMAENQTPHPDYIFSICFMRAIRTEIYLLSHSSSFSMTFPSFFLIFDNKNENWDYEKNFLHFLSTGFLIFWIFVKIDINKKW